MGLKESGCSVKDWDDWSRRDSARYHPRECAEKWASFRGNGKTVSPCFLMPELFDLCGWEGPGFMKLSRQLRNATPLVHSTNRFLTPEGALTNQPPDPEFYQSFLQMQYYREQKGRDIPTER